MTKRTAPRDADKMNELLKQKELSVAEAAQVLELSRQTIYRLIEENALSVTRRKTATMGIFVSTSDVVRYARTVQLRSIPFKSSN